MNLDAAKRGWNGLDDVADERLQSAIAETLARTKTFAAGIFRRDLVETFAALVVVAIFLPALWSVPGWVARAGVVVIIAGAFFIVGVLHWTRRAEAKGGFDVSLDERLAHEIRDVDRQIGLLRSVAWWYVAPCIGGACLFVLGSANFSLGSIAVCVAFALFGYGIHWINRRAVRQRLLPLRESLETLRKDLSSDATAAD